MCQSSPHDPLNFSLRSWYSVPTSRRIRARLDGKLGLTTREALSVPGLVASPGMVYDRCLSADRGGGWGNERFVGFVSGAIEANGCMKQKSPEPLSS